MAEPTASVIIPSYAGATKLPVLLGALAAQNSTDWEAVVVVDGVVDDTLEVLAAYGHLPVRPVVLQTNQGRVAALNAGFAAARGEVLIRCDDDLRPHPDYVANHVAAHADGPVGVVGLCPDIHPDTAYGRAYGTAADVRVRAGTYALPPERRWRAWAANCSVDRATHERVGPYDSSFRAYGWEDADWGYRLHRAGVPIVIDPRVEAPHLGAPAHTHQRALRAYLSGAARHRFEAKHGPEALAEAAPDASPWNSVVGLAARGATATTIPVASWLADAAASVLPPRLGEKAIALVVEASGHAGRLRPPTQHITL